MKVHVLAFATVADALGAQRRLDFADGATPRLSAVRDRLRAEAPQVFERTDLAWAIDGALVATGQDPLLADGCEVAILPPVSGGAPELERAPEPAPFVEPTSRAALVDGPIDIELVRSAVAARGCGATVLFVGTVRDTHNGRPVDSLTYTAYVAMALNALETLVDDLEANDNVRAAIVHRLGEVAAGDISVVLAIASAHREAAFRVGHDALERLKREVPIWKREHFADGDAVWREVESLT
ncbi:MAG: molybdenum cofactor biosynthesis protein MoaE, partial [Acidobacteriota bacterium]